MSDLPVCKAEGCGKPAAKGRRGMCGSHYKRLWKYGSPLAGSTANGVPLAWLQSHIDYDGPGCLLWPFGQGSNGRGIIHYRNQGMKPANLMCELVNGPRPSARHQGAHSCGNGHLGCCHPQHLSWKTQAGNEADKLIHGTSNRGERNGKAKLAAAEVIAIYGDKSRSHEELALEYGVSPATISYIQSGTRWSWLTRPESQQEPAQLASEAEPGLPRQSQPSP